MTTSKVLVVEGASDLLFLRALEQRIGPLSRQRDAYSRAHELAHHVMAASGANDTGMSLVLDNFLLLSDSNHLQLANWPASLPAGVVQPRSLLISLSASTPSALHLPVWDTRAFAGVTGQAWFDSEDGTLATATPTFRVSRPRPVGSAPSRVTLYVTAVTWSLLVDGWAAMVRVIDSVLTALRLIRLLVRAGLGRRLNALAYVLVIIAACRRYGHRSEPDDHAPLLIRRHPTSAGSRLPA
jgi:hypothetical protein